MTSVNLPTSALLSELIHAYSDSDPSVRVDLENVHAEEHGHSTLFHLTVSWQGQESLPRQLMLKSCPSNGKEVAFYSTLARKRQLPVPACFGALTKEDQGLSLILLEDYSDSHENLCDWPSPLPALAAQQLVEALASLHAAFWNRSPLAAPAAGMPTFLCSETNHSTFCTFLRRDYEAYLSAVKGNLAADDTLLYQTVLDLLPSLWAEFWQPRLAAGKVSLIHGDLNPRNVLYPKHIGGNIYFVDWEACRLGLPASDLSMLLGLHLCPDMQQALPLLRQYYAGLRQSGVNGYTLNDLYSDYQIALFYDLFYPFQLFTQAGIQDEIMRQNALEALRSFGEIVG